MTESPTKEEKINKIKDLTLFDGCHPEFFGHMANQAHAIALHKGQVIFIHEDPADKFYLITKGWIKLFRETLDGTQAVVDILTQGHILGETAIFQDDIYPYSAEATEPTEILAFPLSLLKQEIEENPKLALSMLTSMARYRRQQDREIEHRTIQNAPQRIGCFLLRLASQNEHGKTTIHLPYDKTLIASRLGMQPETFSRALGKLKQETGIEIKGSSITLESLSQLSNYSCAACSSEFPCKDIDKAKESIAC